MASSFFTESKKTLKILFIAVGIFQIISLNVAAVAIGVLFVYWGLMLDKLLPNREKVIANTLMVIVALYVISAGYLLSQKFFDVSILQVVLPILFILYVIKSVKEVSLKQRALEIVEHNVKTVSNLNGERLALQITLIVLVVLAGMVITHVIMPVVLDSLNSEKQNAVDASIKANLANMRVGAEIYYDSNNNSYSSANDCLSGMFSDPQYFVSALTAVKTNTDVVCYAADKSYAVSASLKSNGVYCIDSSGFADYGVATNSFGKAYCETQTASASDSSAWQTFTPDNQRFSIQFLTSPEHEVETVGADIAGVEYTRNSYMSFSSATYVVDDYVYASNIDKGNGEMLKNALSMLPMSDEWRLVRSEQTVFSGHDAINFEFKVKTENVKGMLVKKDDASFFVLMYDYIAYNDQDYQKFISSFQIN